MPNLDRRNPEDLPQKPPVIENEPAGWRPPKKEPLDLTPINLLFF